MESRIPVGLVVAGPTIATDAVLFDSIIDRLKAGERVAAVNIDSTQIPNLKSALKYINRHASNQGPNADDEDTTSDDQQVRVRGLSENLSLTFDLNRVVAI